ncbi:hypothetical protein KFK09_023073 [Dendrobium nobile]|uniref:Uncharacterized protein n=1 Tax=Dendrobium nobile TaxID=94219 RepID=A0A8T3AK09_DENNO|nr:hypothetical protein KFK09_023073 [Dendrobium nobile]
MLGIIFQLHMSEEMRRRSKWQCNPMGFILPGCHNSNHTPLALSKDEKMGKGVDELLSKLLRKADLLSEALQIAAFTA